jgi:NADPH:quinone reductase-like Zn-dependent oxidoreductase
MATHAAIVTVGPGLPLEIHQVPTPTPTVRVKSEWTASTLLDLHEADGGLLVKHPQGLGDGVAGTVVEIGPDVTRLKVGDKVFGFTWRVQAEKAHQEFVVAPEFLFGKLPNGVTMQQAVTLPNNFVTVWHTLTKDFGFELPWPKPEGYTPEGADQGILVWGGSSSVGQYALQVLKWYGYRNVIATASKHHHEKLQRYGAVKCFDYRDTEVIKSILDFASSQARKRISYICDCIGSLEGSVRPVANIASPGTKVAILLPVIVKDAANGVKPEYEMDVKRCAYWQSGVEAVGVRTHFYLENKFLADKLQPEIMPTLLGNGIVEPNEQVIVEGKTMLERAERALSMLRDKKISGARLVWKVSDS